MCSQGHLDKIIRTINRLLGGARCQNKYANILNKYSAICLIALNFSKYFFNEIQLFYIKYLTIMLAIIVNILANIFYNFQSSK